MGIYCIGLLFHYCYGVGIQKVVVVEVIVSNELERLEALAGRV